MSIKVSFATALLSSVCTLILLPVETRAQNDANAGSLLDEVIVTAQKREANLQDTPLSISAMSGDTLERIGIDTVDDFQFFVPGITVTNDSMAIVNIRAIGTSAFGVATDPSTTVHIDGVYQPRPTTGLMDMFDVERVELLRGPQGVLFGRNSTGGTLNIISKMPTREFEGTVGLTAGNLNKFVIDGMVSGSLSDNVRGRLTLRRNQRDGRYTDIVTGATYQDQDTTAARGTLVIDMSDDFSLEIRADYNRDRETGFPAVRATYEQDIIDAGATIPSAEDDVAFDTAPVNDTDTWGLSVTASWVGDNYSFKSLTSYRESVVDQTLDADATDLFLFDIGFRENSRSFTQELQFSNTNPDRLEWIVGMFFLSEDGDGGIDILFPNPTINIEERNTTNAYAVFGQATYNISDRFRATAGARYSYERKNYSFSTVVNGAVVDAGAPSDNWDDITPRFALDFDITDDVMVYLSATKGFKSGGFQLGDAGSFDPEELWSYEAGVKSMLLDGRMRANLGLFSYDYTNLQVVEFIGGVATTSNAGKATVEGIEAEIAFRVTDRFDINGTLALMDAKYDVFFEQGEDFAGNRLANAPDLTYTLGAQYTYDLNSGAILIFRGDYAYRDDVDFKRNNLPQFRSDSYSLLNARASFITANNRWEFSVYGRNLTDDRYATYITVGRNAASQADINVPVTVHGAPIQYGALVRLNF